jgi:hypothetical protein
LRRLRLTLRGGCVAERLVEETPLLTGADDFLRIPNSAGRLFICEKRQQDFALFSDQAQKCSTSVLLALLEIGISYNNSLYDRVLHFRVGLCDRHSVNIKRHIFDRRITFFQSN